MYTGIAKRKKLRPPARMTTISLVLLKRLKVIREANNTDIGNVKITMLGKANTKAFITSNNGAPYSVIYWAILNNVPVPIKILVKANTPNRKGPTKAFNIYLSNNRIVPSYNLKLSPK